MTRNGSGNGSRLGYGMGRSNGRGVVDRGNGQCRRDGTGFRFGAGFSGSFGSGGGQGRGRCRFEENDGRTGFSAFNRIGAHPFASAIARIEAAVEDLKRQINDLRQRP